jgi:hypothetical protein
MKCIQAVKESKNYEVGTILRIDDKEANFKVDSGYWKFIPKIEWKKTRVKSEPKTQEEFEKREKTQSKKSQNRSKLKEKQRQ